MDLKPDLDTLSVNEGDCMATQMTPEYENIGQAGEIGTGNPKISVAEAAKTLDLGAMAQRNAQRKEIKKIAPPAPWYVTGTSYRGTGTKYEVKRKAETSKNGMQSDLDEIILPGGTDRPVKEFIAFCRNDEPESDIDELIMAIHRLAFFEAARNQLAEYVQVLEAKNSDLEKTAARQAKELATLEARRVSETTNLQNSRVDELAALEHRRVTELAALEHRRVSELAALDARRLYELETLEAQRVAQTTQIQGDFDAYIGRTDILHAGAAVLRDALGFYATEKNWDWSLMTNPMLKDSGTRAKNALADSELGKHTQARLQKLEAMARRVSNVLEHTAPPGDSSWKALDSAYQDAVGE